MEKYRIDLIKIPITFMKMYRSIIVDIQLTCNVLCIAHRIKYRALQFQ